MLPGTVVEISSNVKVGVSFLFSKQSSFVQVVTVMKVAFRTETNPGKTCFKIYTESKCKA